jgi:hypothetical protein
VNGEIEVTMDPKALPSSANRRGKRLDWHRSISWARDSFFFFGVGGRIVFLVAPFFFSDDTHDSSCDFVYLRADARKLCSCFVFSPFLIE